ncbi:MAG: glutamate racemase [bacterium]
MIGVFDSGIGGLSVYKELMILLPHETCYYLADQIHVPYGPRSQEQIREFSEKITRFLINQGVNIVVIACNTISAAALYYLRRQFPDIIFVGMEPAVKPSIEKTRSGIIGVIATQATFQGRPYEKLIEKYARNVKVVHQSCPGLVEQVEEGNIDTPEIRFLLKQYLTPMIEKRVDQLVLGCTHYHFLKSVIQEIIGENVSIIDPTHPVAKQAVSVLNRYRNEKRLTEQKEQTGQKKHQFFTSSNINVFTTQISRFLPTIGKNFEVREVNWNNRGIVE